MNWFLGKLVLENSRKYANVLLCHKKQSICVNLLGWCQAVDGLFSWNWNTEKLKNWNVFELGKKRRTFAIYCNKLVDYHVKMKLKRIITVKNQSLAFKTLNSLSFWNQLNMLFPETFLHSWQKMWKLKASLYFKYSMIQLTYICWKF